LIRPPSLEQQPRLLVEEMIAGAGIAPRDAASKQKIVLKQIVRRLGESSASHE
jgi:hypothetical protein